MRLYATPPRLLDRRAYAAPPGQPWRWVNPVMSCADIRSGQQIGSLVGSRDS